MTAPIGPKSVAAVSAPSGRWVLGEVRRYAWAQCRFCGRAQDHDCPAATCLLCGSTQCYGNGPDCRVCYHGFLPGWSRPTGCQCGHRGCATAAVARAPRVHRVCLAHARTTKLRIGGRTVTIAERAAELVAHRDSGDGWEHWRWTT